MQRIYPWLSVILFLGCAALGYLIVLQRVEMARIDMRENEAGRTEREQTADFQKRLILASDGSAAAERKIAQLKQGPAAPGESPAPARKSKTIHISDIIRDHPEFAALQAAQARTNVVRKYGAELSRLDLPPEQLSRLKDLLAARDSTAQDAQQAAQAEGLAPGSAGYKNAVKQAELVVEQQITALLGTDGTKFVLTLQSQYAAQNTVQTIYDPDFEDAGAGLNPDQSRSLAEAIGGTAFSGERAALRPRQYNDVDPVTSLSPHDNAILNAASATLNPAQLDILKTDLMQAHQASAILQEYSAKASGPVSIEP